MAARNVIILQTPINCHSMKLDGDGGAIGLTESVGAKRHYFH